jgi:putative ABC transport system permease protein
MKKRESKPPRWADRFLSWYCNPKLLEQIQGDVHELFYWRLEEEGYSNAKRSFVWDVFRFFRWSNIKRRSSNKTQFNNTAMFKNYFKIGLRNLWKQRLPSTINILGLSLAIGCSVVAFKWIESTYTKDDFHENLDDLFLVTHWEDLEVNKGRAGSTDNRLTREILSSVAGIKYSSRYGSNGNLETKQGEKLTSNYAYFVDPEYLDMFSFEFIAGDPNTLNDDGNIIIDESTSTRFFGNELAVGKILEMKIGDAWKPFQVGAVVKDKPNNSSLRNNTLINYIHLEQLYSSQNREWNTNFFIQKQSDTKPSDLEVSMNALLPIFNKDQEEGSYLSFQLEPLTTMATNAYEIFGGVGFASPTAPNVLLASIALFMLILATFNYINISMAMAMKRMKEIGIRKVIGSKRKQLISQFLIENFILCALSMMLGVFLAGGLFLPWFNNIAGGDLQVNILGHKNLWKFLGGLLIFITLASGLYPAIVASSFKAISIIKKERMSNGNGLLSGVFMTFQMILAMITIVGAVMCIYTNQVNQSRDWGYDQYNKLTVTVPDSKYFEVFREALDSDPSITKVASSKASIGRQLNGVPFKFEEQLNYAELFDVGYDIPNLFQFELLEGRFFDKTLASDVDKALVVNEAFMNAFQLDFKEEGIPILLDSAQYTIVGVVKDYHYWAFDEKIRGAAMRVVPTTEHRLLVLEMREGDILAQRDALMNSLGALAPDYNINISVQELTFDDYFRDLKGIRNILLFTAIMAITLAAMGLYGLVNINVSTHIKDFGIRKVLGANGFQLAQPVYKKFRNILGLAVLIGGSLAVLVVQLLLETIYAYSAPIGILPISGAALILLLVAFITLNLQVARVKKLNPAETLRMD